MNKKTKLFLKRRTTEDGKICDLDRLFDNKNFQDS